MRELMADTEMLDGILRDGVEKARSVSTPILQQTMQKVGFLQL